MKFDNGKYAIYKFSGKVFNANINPSLFWKEFEIPESVFQKPLLNIPIDTKVLVWDKHDLVECKRHFADWTEDGKIRCWNDGNTSWTISCLNEHSIWDNWEIVEED